MIGDKLHIEQNYYLLARQILAKLLPNNKPTDGKIVIGVAGESGSGKSVTAACIESELKQNGINTVSITMDDYFKLPSADNHQNRLANIDNVGTHEVHLDLLEQHVNAFKNNEKSIIAPVSNFEANTLGKQVINFENATVLIIEGTYVLGLPNLDFKIFLERDYTQTVVDRIKRGREPFDPFIEKVLSIEHEIISKFNKVADIVIDKDFCIKP